MKITRAFCWSVFLHGALMLLCCIAILLSPRTPARLFFLGGAIYVLVHFIKTIRYFEVAPPASPKETPEVPVDDEDENPPSPVSFCEFCGRDTGSFVGFCDLCDCDVDRCEVCTTCKNCVQD